MKEIVPGRYLFVCLANIHRSRSAERVFSELVMANDFSVGKLSSVDDKDYYIGSAGIGVDFYEIRGSIQYTREMGESVDMIFGADDLVCKGLVNCFHTPVEKVENLHVPDIYDSYNMHERRVLENIMRGKFSPYIPIKR